MSWAHMPLRRLFRIVNGGTPSVDPDNWYGDIWWATPIDIGRVNGGRLAATDRSLTRKGLEAGSRTIGPASLVVSTRAPIGYVAETVTEMAFNQGCRGLEPKVELDIRYFRYQLHALSDRLLAAGQGSTFVELSSESLASTPVAAPPAHEQRAIADFLDTETARIDALITKKRRLIDLLEKRYWGMVANQIESFNAGLVPLRRFIQAITDGPFGSSLTSGHYSEEGARVVRLGNIGRNNFKDADQAFIPMDHYAGLKKHSVRPGDLLIAGLGDSNNHVGRACVAPDLGPAIVKADCYCARVDPDRALADFLALFLSSPAGAHRIALAARGTTRSRINLDIAKNIQVPQLPLLYQREAVEVIQHQRNLTARLTGLLGRQIEELQEHRQALVTAAVTGEVDVPGAAS